MRSRFSYLVIAPILAVSVLLLVVGVAAAWYAHSMNKAVSGTISRKLTAVLSSERLVLEIRDIRLDLNQATRDASYLQAALGSRREVERSIRDLERTMTEDDVRGMLQPLAIRSEKLFTKLDSADIVDPAGLRDIQEELSSSLLPQAEKLLKLNRESASSASQRSQEVADRMGSGLLLLGVCGSVAGLLGGYGIARWVSRSIVQLSLPIHDTAGKLNEIVGPVTVTTGDGLHGLEAAMRTISDKTSAVIDRLQKSQNEGLRLEQMAAIGQMAAGLAHELRNPLMSMKILVQAADEPDRPRGLQGRDLQVLHEEIHRLEHLTQVFLDYARGRQPEKQPLDLAEIIQQAVSIVSSRAARQQVSIHFEPCEPGQWVEADATQIRQLLLNLLLNSLDALPQGGNIWITADRERNPSGVESVSIRVADDGHGLPKELGQRIFDPFVSGKETGVGLGLSICKQIVEGHGGSIVSASRPQAGAEFTVRLPVRVESETSAVPASNDSSLGHVITEL